MSDGNGNVNEGEKFINRANDAYLDHTVLTRQYKYLYIKQTVWIKTMCSKIERDSE